MKKFLVLTSFFLLFFNFCFSFQNFLLTAANNKFTGSSLTADFEQVAYDLCSIPAKYFFKIYYKNGKFLYIGNLFQPYFEKEDLIKAGKDAKIYVPKENLKQNKIFFDGSKFYIQTGEKSGLLMDITKIPELNEACPDKDYKKIKTEKINNVLCDVYEIECFIKDSKCNIKSYINKDKIKIKNIMYHNDKLTRVTDIKNCKLNVYVDDNILKPEDGVQYQDITQSLALFLSLDAKLTEDYVSTGNTETAQTSINDIINQSIQKSMENELKKSIPQSQDELLRKMLIGW